MSPQSTWMLASKQRVFLVFAGIVILLLEAVA
jgi:hypothetical protein